MDNQRQDPKPKVWAAPAGRLLQVPGALASSHLPQLRGCRARAAQRGEQKGFKPLSCMRRRCRGGRRLPPKASREGALLAAPSTGAL